MMVRGLHLKLAWSALEGALIMFVRVVVQLVSPPFLLILKNNELALNKLH